MGQRDKEQTLWYQSHQTNFLDFFGDPSKRTGSREPDKPTLSPLGEDEIADIALEVRNTLHFKHPSDFDNTLATLGGKSLYRDFWDPRIAKKAAINMLANGRFTIYLSNSATNKVNNFSIAHELGHYFIHFLKDEYRNALSGDSIDKENNMVAYRFGETPVERQANIFAANFLMPKDLFREYSSSVKFDLELVSEKFGVEYFIAKRWMNIVS